MAQGERWMKRREDEEMKNDEEEEKKEGRKRTKRERRQERDGEGAKQGGRVIGWGGAVGPVGYF